MKVALLTAHDRNPWPNLGDAFITLSLRGLLAEHRIAELPLHHPLDSEGRALARGCDRILVGGTNLVGVGGTVRCAHSENIFRALDRPVFPLGIGAQSALGGRVRIDDAGVRLLRHWRRSSGPISVRDELTRNAIESAIGRGETRLTGCPTLFLEWRARVRRGNAIFVPGPFRAFLSPSRQARYERLCAALARGRTAIAQQADALRASYAVYFAPEDPFSHLDAVTGAESILSFRIHPLLVGIVNGVPGLLIALDERTKSMARTIGAPYLEYRSDLTADEVTEAWRRALEDFPWATVREKVASLREGFREHLRVTGLATREAPVELARLGYGLAMPTARPSAGTAAMVTLLKRLPVGTLMRHLAALKGSIAPKAARGAIRRPGRAWASDPGTIVDSCPRGS